MFRPGFILDTTEKLDAAIHNKAKVNVWQDNELIEYGVIIKSHSDDAVKVDGVYYLKALCVFRIC